MKAVILFFWLVFCVTADAESGAPAGADPETEKFALEEKPLKTAWIWKLWKRGEENQEEIQEAVLKEDFMNCLNNCKDVYWHVCDPTMKTLEEREGCYNDCKNRYKSERKRYNIESRYIEMPSLPNLDELRFNCSGWTCDYDCCVNGCMGDGGSSSQCHRACRI